ncbi:MAG TPA: VOC family protein [Candidatus Baltobacteraceae bacterium]
MAVKSIAFTAYPAKDAQALLVFYRDAVGLVVGRAHPDQEHAQFVEFDAGADHWFSIIPEDFAGRPAGSASGVVFEVDDIEKAFADVRKHAKSADAEIADHPSCRMVSFEDPEGNKASLHQAK